MRRYLFAGGPLHNQWIEVDGGDALIPPAIVSHTPMDPPVVTPNPGAPHFSEPVVFQYLCMEMIYINRQRKRTGAFVYGLDRKQAEALFLQHQAAFDFLRPVL